MANFEDPLGPFSDSECPRCRHPRHTAETVGACCPTTTTDGPCPCPSFPFDTTCAGCGKSSLEPGGMPPHPHDPPSRSCRFCRYASGHTRQVVPGACWKWHGGDHLMKCRRPAGHPEGKYGCDCDGIPEAPPKYGRPLAYAALMEHGYPLEDAADKALGILRREVDESEARSENAALDLTTLRAQLAATEQVAEAARAENEATTALHMEIVRLRLLLPWDHPALTDAPTKAIDTILRALGRGP